MKHFVLTATAWAALSWAAATSAAAQTLDACQSKDVLQQRSLKTDATLDGLLRTAALDHPSIQSRLSEQEAAQAVVDSAKWGYFPSPSITRERTNPIPTDPSYQAGGAVSVLGLRQSVWTGGRLSSSKEKALENLNSRMYGSQEQKEAVAAQLLDVYAGWLRTQRQLQSTDASIQVHKDLYEHVDHRIAGGWLLK